MAKKEIGGSNETMSLAQSPRARGWGEGTIVERTAKNGTVTFLAQVWAGGVRHAKTLPTRPEAQRWIRRTLTDAEKGIVPTAGGKLTVAAFLEEWLKAKKAGLKPKTQEDYAWAVNNHLGPAFARVKLADLRPNQLQTLYGTKLDAGLSVRSVHHLHRVAHNALSDAVLWGYVPRNVADAVKAPSPPRIEHQVWTSDEARAFLGGIAGERYEAAFVLGITCGMRVGEVAGLKWEDLDLEAQSLQIQRTRQRIKRFEPAAGEARTEVADGATKTKRGARLIILPTLAALALRRWRVHQIEERLGAGPVWTDTGYIFTYSTGNPIEPGDIHTAFDKIVTRLGLPKIRPHDLRHTCATLLLAQNVNPKFVQELLGHSQITVTMDLYSHVLPAMHQEAARTMERVFGTG
jgi:integrase